MPVCFILDTLWNPIEILIDFTGYSMGFPLISMGYCRGFPLKVQLLFMEQFIEYNWNSPWFYRTFQWIPIESPITFYGTFYGIPNEIPITFY